MREIARDDRGVIRFKANGVVRWLVDTGRVGLTDIASHLPSGDIPIEDIEEFFQMLGYSVSGFGDLGFVRPETVAAADEIAAGLSPASPTS